MKIDPFVLFIRVMFACVFVAAVVASCRVHAHDQYVGLQPDGSTGTTSPCCGNRDCEGIAWDDVRIHPDGSASLYSKRWGRSVLVAAVHITPVGLPPNDKGEVFPAHWCGDKRSPQYTPHEGGVTDPSPRPEDQPDPTLWTYCAFIAPGGA